MSEKLAAYRDKQAKEIDHLRLQSKAATGVGNSLRSLAPVVANELRAVIGMKAQQGALSAEWSAALEAAAKSDAAPEDESLAALSIMLAGFAGEAGKRILSHADILLTKAGELEGQATGIEATLADISKIEADEGDESAAVDSKVEQNASLP